MAATGFAPSSRNRLTRHDLGRFAGDGLFDRVGRVVCGVECLPRKELFEAWEVARRVRRRFRGGRVLDVAGGHGLLAYLLLLLDDSSSEALVIDPMTPSSAPVLSAALEAEWPRLLGRVTHHNVELAGEMVAPGDLLVACHACGALTDRVLDAAMTASARVAVLPCCHDEETCDAGPLRGWLDLPTAVDVMRAQRLAAAGAQVWTQTIPETITPKRRLLLADCRHLTT
ncbi:MAG: methyltransferase [Vicinamibacterales bacterium]